MSEGSSAPVALQPMDEKRRESVSVPVTPAQERDLSMQVSMPPRLRDQLRSINGFAVQWQGADLRIPLEAFGSFEYVPPIPPPPMPELSSAAMALQPTFRPPGQPQIGMPVVDPPASPTTNPPAKPPVTHTPAHAAPPQVTSPQQGREPHSTIQGAPIQGGMDNPKAAPSQLPDPKTNHIPKVDSHAQVDKPHGQKSAVPEHKGHKKHEQAPKSVFRHPHKEHKLGHRSEMEADTANTGPVLFPLRVTRADTGDQAIAYLNAGSAFSAEFGDFIANDYYYLSGFPDTNVYDLDGTTVLHTGNEICEIPVDNAGPPPTMAGVAWYKTEFCISGETKTAYIFRTALV